MARDRPAGGRYRQDCACPDETWCQQQHGSDQDGAVKERVEIVFRQKREYAVRCKRLSRPKKNWRKDPSNDNRRNKICRQFNYVFQGRLM